MTEIPDARVAAWTCAWNAITAAQELRQPQKTRGPRVAPEPLPELYWAAITEAAVFADLARADLSTGEQALTIINALETATQAAVDTLTNIFGVPRPDADDPISDAIDDAEHQDYCEPLFYAGRRVRLTRGGWSGRRGVVTKTYPDNEPPVMNVELDESDDPASRVVITVLPGDVEIIPEQRR